MNDLTRRNFGLLIAYVLPGLVVLFGMSLISPTAAGWLHSAQVPSGPTVGSFLFAFLFSIAAGVTISAIRWLLLDRLHQSTGIKRPQLDLENLEQRLQSFERVIEDHYRYYEFYGGMLIATAFTYITWRITHGMGVGVHDLLFITLETVFALASRDALRNYYGRAARVLGTIENEECHDKRIRSSRAGSHGHEHKAERSREGVAGRHEECPEGKGRKGWRE